MTDTLDKIDRLFLEKLRLAVAVILEAGEDPDALNNVFESELFLFRDRVDHALLSRPVASGSAPATS